MKLYFFRCSDPRNSDQSAISLDSYCNAPLDNLAGSVSPHWVSDLYREPLDVEDGDDIPGFNAADVYRDLKQQRFHIPRHK
jgi:hypothetical protein